MKKTYQITVDGRKELEKELEQLINRRSEVSDRIAEARDYGDLSENAEYDSAREEQGIVETRIAEIEDILMHAEVIKGRKSDKVQLGSTVVVKTGKREMTYKIVGSVEADPLEGKISNESPLGTQIMGKRVGESASVTTPKGTTDYAIEEIR